MGSIIQQLIARGVKPAFASNVMAGENQAANLYGKNLNSAAQLQTIQQNRQSQLASIAATQQLRDLGQQLAPEAVKLLGPERGRVLAAGLLNQNPQIVAQSAQVFNQIMAQKQEQPRIEADASGRKRYLKDGSFVFPDENIAPNLGATQKVKFPDGRIGFGAMDKTTGQIVEVPGGQPVQNAPLVQMSPGETATQKERARSLNAEADEINQQAVQSGQMLQSLVLLGQIPAETGPGQSQLNWIKQAASSIGIPLSDATLQSMGEFESYKAVVSDLFLGKQALQKGPQTEGDAKRIFDALPDASNVPAVNAMVRDVLTAQSQYRILQDEFYDDYFETNDSFAGAQRAWRNFKRQTPMTARHPKTETLVFMNEFMELKRQAGMPADEALAKWRELANE